MCRWLAYSGSPILLEELLYKPAHSLIDQSMHSRLGVETTNGDGFGVGWYGSEGLAPAVFREVGPAWSDRNLREMAGHVASPLFLAHIRASTGTAVQQTNCHPFRHGSWLWVHNGAIRDFSQIKRELVLAVDPSLYPAIEGSTDSEVMFFLALTLGLDGDPPAAVEQMVGFVEAAAAGHGIANPLQMTIGASNGSAVWAFPLLKRGPLTLTVLQHEDADNAAAVPRQPRLPDGLRRHQADRLRAARRPARRLERGARVQLRRRTARRRRTPPLPAEVALGGPGVNDLRFCGHPRRFDGVAPSGLPSAKGHGQAPGTRPVHRVGHLHVNVWLGAVAGVPALPELVTDRDRVTRSDSHCPAA